MSLHTAFSRLPSGHRVEGRTYVQIAKMLKQEYLDSDTEKARQKEIAERIDFYCDRFEPHVRDLVRRQFGHRLIINEKQKLVPEASYQNLVKRIIDETSTHYAEPAKREVAVGNDGYQRFLTSVDFHRKMDLVAKHRNLCNEVLVWFGVRGDGEGNNQPRMRLITPDQFWAVSDPYDPAELVAYVIKLPARGVDRKDRDPHYVLWSDDAIAYLDRHWQIVQGFRFPDDAQQIEPGVIANPIGRIPGVLVHRSVVTDKLLDADPGRDLIRAQRTISLLSLLLIDEQKNGTVLVYAQGRTKDLANGQPLDRRFVVEVPEDVILNSIDLQAKPESYLQTASAVIRQVAANYGIPGDVFDLSFGATSGFEIQLKRARLREIRRHQAKDFAAIERELCEVAAVVMDAEASPEYRFSADGFTIDFGEPEVPRSAKEKLEVRQLARKLGLSNPIDEVRSDNPDLDDEGAREVIQRNLTIWLEFLQVVKEANGLDIGDRNPRDNGALPPAQEREPDAPPAGPPGDSAPDQ